MSLSKQLSLLSVAVLFCSSLLNTASAELVSFAFKGRTQATIDGTFFPSLDFNVLVSIDDTSPDQFPFQNGRGGFLGATTTLTIPDAGIFDAQSTNVTGIVQESFGNNSRLRLVDGNNLFGSAALGVSWNSAVFPDPDSLNPLLEPLPAPTNAEGGLQWQLLLGPNVTFNSVFEVAVANVASTGSANVPEPTSFTLCGIGLLAIAFKRRRR